MDGQGKVSSIALATLKTNNYNKPEMLPLTADLVLLRLSSTEELPDADDGRPE